MASILVQGIGLGTMGTMGSISQVGSVGGLAFSDRGCKLQPNENSFDVRLPLSLLTFLINKMVPMLPMLPKRGIA